MKEALLKAAKDLGVTEESDLTRLDSDTLEVIARHAGVYKKGLKIEMPVLEKKAAPKKAAKK